MRVKLKKGRENTGIVMYREPQKNRRRVAQQLLHAVSDDVLDQRAHLPVLQLAVNSSAEALFFTSLHYPSQKSAPG